MRPIPPMPVRGRRLAVMLVGAGLALGAAPAAAQDPVGVNAAIRNSVQTRSGASSLRPAVLRAPVALGDQYVTGAASQVQVLLKDRSTFTVGANASVTVDRFLVSQRDAAGLTASVARGAFRFASGRTNRGPSRQAINTPTASMGIRGTIVEGVVGPDALAILRNRPGVPPFTGDEDTMLLVVLRGPDGRTRSFDTPGAIDLQHLDRTETLDRTGQAMIVTSDGFFGPFFLTDEVSRGLADLLSPPPDADAAADEDSAAFLAFLIEDRFLDDGFETADPGDYEPLPFGDDPRNSDDFPFFPPPRPGP